MVSLVPDAFSQTFICWRRLLFWAPNILHYWLIIILYRKFNIQYITVWTIFPVHACHHVKFIFWICLGIILSVYQFVKDNMNAKHHRVSFDLSLVCTYSLTRAHLFITYTAICIMPYIESAESMLNNSWESIHMKIRALCSIHWVRVTYMRQ